MRENDRAHLVLALLQVRDVGQHEVDAEVLILRKGEPCVDDEDALFVLEDGHVLADLTEPAERDHAERCLCHPLSVAPAPSPARFTPSHPNG